MYECILENKLKKIIYRYIHCRSSTALCYHENGIFHGMIYLLIISFASSLLLIILMNIYFPLHILLQY